MDEYIYYWVLLDQYCYRSELDKRAEQWGHNYSCHQSDEFFRDIWVDKE